MDPLTTSYPELTPCQFASNGPIDAIDLDGLERLWYVKKFEYEGKWYDVTSAISNGVINTVNLVPELWNSTVNAYESIERGTVIEDTRNDFKRMREGAKQGARYLYNASFTDLATNPEILEIATSFYMSSRIPLPKAKGAKGNLLKPATTRTSEGVGGSRDVNPLRGDKNCAGCTVAGDASLKGRPASALNHGITSVRDFFNWFGGLQGVTAHTSTQSIINVMSKMKDGATGVIFGDRGAGKVGHFFNVTKRNGVVQFVDFQKRVGERVLNPKTLMKDEKFKQLIFKSTTED
jgi:hypothetical protein